jgi:hypothetical protein
LDYMALDANFCLKHKECGLSTDAPLGEGSGYFDDHGLLEKELGRVKAENGEPKVSIIPRFYFIYLQCTRKVIATQHIQQSKM